ncbi:MAG TPA: MliC family protein [Acidobacteriaceae bacterium]|nr:MliC family protein [Acidobacteriaceae bacterium]
MQTIRGLVLPVALGFCAVASASDLTIHLKGTQPLSRKTVQYQCDAKGAGMGLPAGIFAVEYINGDGNSLVVVPVHDSSLILANVISGSGARYAAGPYIWWEAQGSVTFYSDSIAGKTQSACHPVIAH